MKTRFFQRITLDVNSAMERLWKAISDGMRRRWTNRQRFLVACIFCGLVCGLMAVFFHWSISTTFHWFWNWAMGHDNGWETCLYLVTFPALAGLVCGMVMQWHVPEAQGSGIPQTKAAYYNHGGKVRSHLGMWRILLGTIFIGFGNALGREGPIVHASAAVASRIGRFVFKDPERVRAMIPVGMAAGVGAAFNAPLSAITFVFEELLDNFSTKAIGGIVVAVVIAAAVSRTILGEDPVISTHLSLHYETSAWMLVAVPLGALAGLLGHFFVESVIHTRHWVKTHSAYRLWYAPAAGGLVCGAVGLLAWWLTGSAGNAQNGVFSIGYESLEQAFENNLVVTVLLVLLLGKFVAVVMNYATGGSGGLFSPTLFLGGMLGGLVGNGLVELGRYMPLFSNDEPSQIIGGCVLLGMGAMFGSVIRCPFTSLIIIFEMTGNYSLILPLMAGNMLSWAIARKMRPVAVYDALLIQDGVTMKRMPAYRGAQDYRSLPVSAIMTHDVTSVGASRSHSENLKRLKGPEAMHHAYVVLDDDGGLVGLITRRELLAGPVEQKLEETLKGRSLVTAFPETSIRDVTKVMLEQDIQQVPVVSVVDKHRLLGIVTHNDITRQHNASAL